MGPLAKFDPFIKGEPPFSEKFNKFSSDFTTDINTAAKQIDYVNAKLINGFTTFFGLKWQGYRFGYSYDVNTLSILNSGGVANCAGLCSCFQN